MGFMGLKGLELVLERLFKKQELMKQTRKPRKTGKKARKG
jgi:hypothetical protein